MFSHFYARRSNKLLKHSTYVHIHTNRGQSTLCTIKHTTQYCIENKEAAFQNPHSDQSQMHLRVNAMSS